METTFTLWLHLTFWRRKQTLTWSFFGNWLAEVYLYMSPGWEHSFPYLKTYPPVFGMSPLSTFRSIHPQSLFRYQGIRHCQPLSAANDDGWAVRMTNTTAGPAPTCWRATPDASLTDICPQKFIYHVLFGQNLAAVAIFSCDGPE